MVDRIRSPALARTRPTVSGATARSKLLYQGSRFQRDRACDAA
jgi:hypothetical protein